MRPVLDVTRPASASPAAIEGQKANYRIHPDRENVQCENAKPLRLAELGNPENQNRPLNGVENAARMPRSVTKRTFAENLRWQIRERLPNRATLRALRDAITQALEPVAATGADVDPQLAHSPVVGGRGAGSPNPRNARPSDGSDQNLAGNIHGHAGESLKGMRKLFAEYVKSGGLMPRE